MRSAFLPTWGLLGLALFAFALPSLAQGPVLKFKAGPVAPEKNVASFTAQPSQFAPALFGGRYYVILQFEALPDAQMRGIMAAGGVRLYGYMPDMAFFASLPEGFSGSLAGYGVRSVIMPSVQQKMERGLGAGIVPAWAERPNDKAELEVLVLGKPPIEIIAPALFALGAEIVLDKLQLFDGLVLRVPKQRLRELASLPFVQWVEPIGSPNKVGNQPGKNNHRSNLLEYGARNLTGAGVRLGEWDGSGAINTHLDFGNRITVGDNVVSTNALNQQHAIHVAGTMSGAGLLNPFARGMAPNSLFYTYDFQGDVPTEMASAISNFQILLTQNSWGPTATICEGRPYGTFQRAIDLLANNNPSLLHVFAMGNAQQSCDEGWFSASHAAKNDLSVGALNNSDVIANFSSFGPTEDGRIKPEISAVGVSVFSTFPNNTYQGGDTWSGTSMACPGVSGTAAQLYERFRQLNNGNDPRGALIKALLCNTADDVNNAGPDYRTGFGRVNGLRAVKVMEAGNYRINSVANGVTRQLRLDVPEGAAQLRIMLTWNDPAGVVNANPSVVNNLNLRLLDPEGTIFNPWGLDPANPGGLATRKVNNIDNIEQVTIDNPISGQYLVQVIGASVPVGPQEYALVWETNPTYLEVTYPSAGEIVQPGTVTVQWNGAGLTGNQTLEASTDNGANWTVVSNSIPASARRFEWTAPSAAVGQARIRVSSGSTTAQSGNFHLIGTPGTLTATPSGCTANLTWGTVTGATGYDVMQLNTSTYQWETIFANVAGTSQTVNLNGLTWFSVRARNNAQQAVGQRAVAVSANSPGGAPSRPGIVADGPLNRCAGNVTLSATVNYNLSSIPFQAYDPATDNLVALGDEAVSIALPIGFTFNYFGQNQTQFYIGSNGYIGFGTVGMTASAPQSLPNASIPNNLIALCWRNLDPSAGGSITYRTVGTSPNRRLVVSFNNIQENGNPGAQVIGRIELFETSNLVEIHTQAKNTSGNATQGIENSSGTVGLAATGRNNVAWTVDSPDAFRFTPPPTVTWSNGSIGTSITVPSTPASYSYSFVQGGCTITSESVSITNTPLVFQQASLPAGQIAVAYRQQLSVNNSTTLPTFALTSGSLPNGLSLSAGGLISGTPTAAGTFNFTITATGAAGCSVAKAFSILVPNATPTITSFSPTSGPIGQVVTIIGTNLSWSTAVSFNNVLAINFTIVSDTEVSATVPAGATTGPIRVTTLSGNATSTSDFVVIPPPTITSFSPATGPVGTVVTITGTNLTGATAVSFNNVAASSLTVNSATQVTATVPAGATTGRIRVTTSGGMATSATDFTVSAPTGPCPLTPTGLTGASWDAATRVLTKTAASGWNNASARSQETLPANADGWVEWTIPAITPTFYMAGLADAASNGNWANVDYGIYYAAGQIYVYHTTFGILFTGRNAQAGDTLRVWKRGDRVNFYHNGTALMPFYDYPVNPATPLFFDVSFFSNGASLRNPVSSFCQPAAPAPCNLAWANVAGATFNAANGTLTKTAGTGWGNAGAVSQNSLPANTDGGISWTIPTGPLDQTFYMLGLSTTSFDNSWATVQYGLYYVGGQIYVYLSGANQGFYGTVQPGDRLSVLRTGRTVNFYRNNKSFFGVRASANVSLVADLAMFSSGARVQGLQGHNMCAPARPLAARAEESVAQAFDSPSLAVYPNPTTGRFTVALGSLGRAELSVLDVLGREVLRQTADGPLTSLDLVGQPAGTYLVRVRAEGYVRTVKVVVGE